MRYEEIRNILAPCGLNCVKCRAYVDGDIKKHATQLKESLGPFDNYASRMSNFFPVFKNYPSFKELLDFLTQADCKGCRNGDCKYPNCGVAACYKQKGIDYCFQCNEFPCEKTNFDSDLRERWVRMNTMMKEKGVEAYYEDTKDLPRYS